MRHLIRVVVENNWFHDCAGCDFIHGRPGSGAPDMERNDPPRCAFTLNRKSSGVASSQLATFAAVGC